MDTLQKDLKDTLAYAQLYAGMLKRYLDKAMSLYGLIADLDGLEVPDEVVKALAERISPYAE